MNRILSRSIVVAALLLGAGAAVSAGGWTIITVNDFPDYAVVGEPLALTFVVRQHGNNLLIGLKPVVQASTAGGLEVSATATPTTNAGEYSATLRLSSPGDWNLQVDSGFNPNDRTRQYNSMVLPPLRVIRDASTAPAYSEADRGSRLMVAKGCVGCHSPGSGRDFTRKQFTANYLKTFLANPSLRNVGMPNLELNETEISALIAFINGSRGSADAACSATLPNGIVAGQSERQERSYGNARLSVGPFGLWPNGTVVFKPGGAGFVTKDGALGMKFGWTRGVRGKLNVLGHRLDGAAAPLRLEANDGYGDVGFQASYLIFPTPGCWEVTARVGEREDSKITFVTKVIKIGEGPAWRRDPSGI